MAEFWTELERMEKRGVFGYRTENEDFNREIIRPWEEIRPRYSDFQDTYSQEEMKRDQEKIEKRKKSPEWIEERSEEDIALEYIVADGIYNYDWLGPDATVTLTHEYDDVMRGVDIIISFYDEENNEFVKMGIDVTASEDEKILRDKFDSLIEKSERGKLTEVKYYLPDNPDEKKGKLKVPVVVFQADKEQIKSRIDKFANKNKELMKDEMQTELLEEFEAQLSYLLYVICCQVGPNRPSSPESVYQFVKENKKTLQKSKFYPAIDHYKKVLKIIRKIKKQKSSLGKVGSERAQGENYRILTHPEDYFKEAA